MKEQTLHQLLQYIEQSAELPKQQTPLVVQEMLNNGYITYGIWSLIVILGFIAAFIAFYLFWQLEKEKSQCDGTLALSIILFAFSSIALVINVYMWLYILLCPRLYVLSEIKRLL